MAGGSPDARQGEGDSGSPWSRTVHASYTGSSCISGGGVHPRRGAALPGGDPGRPQPRPPLPSTPTSHRASPRPEPWNGNEAVGEKACSGRICEEQVGCLYLLDELNLPLKITSLRSVASLMELVVDDQLLKAL